MRDFSQCVLPDPYLLITENHSENSQPSSIIEAARLLNQGLAQAALDRLTINQTSTANNVWNWIISATAHCQLKQYSIARELSERGLQLSGKNSRLLDCLGVADCGLENYGNAQRCFFHAVQCDNHNVNAIINLAKIFIQQNHFDTAFEFLQQSIIRNPDNQEIRFLLMQIHPDWIKPLISKQLHLRPLMATDEAFLKRCFTDPVFMKNYHRLMTANRIKQRLDDLKQNPRYNVLKNKSAHWLIEKKQNGAYFPIGMATLADIQLIHERAEILIGFPEQSFRGQGDPLTAMLLLLDFVFNSIGFHKLTSIVYTGNTHSQRSTLALGFFQEGYHQDQLRDLQNGEWIGIHVNGFLQANFRLNQRLSKLSQRLLGVDITNTTSSKKVMDYKQCHDN